MNPHKISAHSDNKQKSYGMLLFETKNEKCECYYSLPAIRQIELMIVHAMLNEM